MVVERLLGHVQFVDELEGHVPGVPSPGCLSSCADYMDIRYVREHIQHYRDNDKVSKKYRGPYSSGWIEVLQRMFSAFRGVGCVFLDPHWGEADLNAWKEQFKKIIAEAKRRWQQIDEVDTFAACLGCYALANGVSYEACNRVPEGTLFGTWTRNSTHLGTATQESSTGQALSGTLVALGTEVRDEEARIKESALIDFLREMKEAHGGEAGGAVASMLQSVVDQFREASDAAAKRGDGEGCE
eukprot:Skav236500  [mRNA]  locus=scaffold78:139405:143762:- [translate_table: standard]